MIKIKNLLRKITYREKASSEEYIKYLKALGVLVGEGTTIYEPQKTVIDVQRPWLLEIGKNVKIAEGVRIITHGFDWCVLKSEYGDVLGSSSKVKIGNNVFIGVGTTILKGVNIGDNVIIGANSLVCKDIPSNTVFAGNPAKQICTLEEYYIKRKDEYENEARETAYEYYKRYNKIPPKEVMYEFFWLFEDENSYRKTEKYDTCMKYMGNEKESIEKMKEIKKKYSNYEEFLKSCNIPINEEIK